MFVFAIGDTTPSNGLASANGRRVETMYLHFEDGPRQSLI